jgi:hypothetical protein
MKNPSRLPRTQNQTQSIWRPLFDGSFIDTATALTAKTDPLGHHSAAGYNGWTTYSQCARTHCEKNNKKKKKQEEDNPIMMTLQDSVQELMRQVTGVISPTHYEHLFDPST